MKNTLIQEGRILSSQANIDDCDEANTNDDSDKDNTNNDSDDNDDFHVECYLDFL